MEQPITDLTEPILSIDSAIWFSAYGFGWGYCAFALPAEVVCECLGATDGSPEQLLMAFRVGKPRLLAAAERTARPGIGKRLPLSANDL
jgi:hypothetical protein